MPPLVTAFVPISTALSLGGGERDRGPVSESPGMFGESADSWAPPGPRTLEPLEWGLDTNNFQGFSLPTKRGSQVPGVALPILQSRAARPESFSVPLPGWKLAG